ncbi:MAG: response regulator [Candidatus Delongbacteria bacterium]|nr:response regulator [Candidatus Delongbacteria bacterium]
MNEKPLILIVDDSVTLRATVRSALERNGFEVEEAENGVLGLQKIEEIDQSARKVKMIFTDIYMPEMDGITFIKELKKTKYRFLPVIVLTTESQQSKKMEGKEAGASGWLLKPFSSEMLISVVKKFVQ